MSYVRQARYLGNTNTMEVHDTENEKVQCQLDEIVEAGHARWFHSLTTAKVLGFDNCHYCIGSSRR